MAWWRSTASCKSGCMDPCRPPRGAPQRCGSYMPHPSRYSQELMQTMLAAVLDSAPGGLRVEEIPVPEPRANEILVKVHACGVCHTDLHVMKAEVAFPTPAVMGHEVTGTVAALGPGVVGPA